MDYVLIFMMSRYSVGFPNIFYLCELMVPSISCDAVTLDENFKPRYCERSHFIEKNVNKDKRLYLQETDSSMIETGP